MGRFIQIPSGKNQSDPVEIVNSDYVVRVRFFEKAKNLENNTVVLVVNSGNEFISFHIPFNTKEEATEWIEKNFIFFNK